MSETSTPPPPKNSTTGRQLQVTVRSIKDLIRNAENCRKHNRAQRRKLEACIRRFGFNVPVLVDANGNILAGHGRIEAAESLGMTELPTICIDHLNEAEAKAFMVADNRIAELSSWDNDRLADLFQDLSGLDLDFNLEITGFSTTEIDLLIDGAELAPTSSKSDPADVVAASAANGPPVAKVGDPFQLGRSFVYCGDSCLEGSYVALMGEKRAVVGFHDFPYNLAIKGHVSGLGETEHREFPMASGEMTKPEFTAFLTAAMTCIGRYTVDGGIAFGCQDWRHIQEMTEAIGASGAQLINLAAWVKDNGAMGSLYRSQHELIFVMKYGQAAHRNNVELGRHGRNRTNVWHYPGMNSFARKTDEGNLLKLHPTVKPVRLIQDAILDVSARDDIVLDSFLGSGGTLIAAERSGRICHGMDLDPLCVDTAIRRWQAFTGERAVHAITGQPFDEIATMVEDHHV